MVLPVQLQLGLELTNIVNPISQAVSALGSLALVDAIKKSGSDSITELKLASLIGRHRIDPVIKFHFREAVAKADRSFLSRYVDIVLESGAGPTVQEALKNPALFSMVVQLSGLAFAHEDEPLANAFVEATERNMREANGQAGAVPDYVSLLGTLRACQQQTVAFRWASLYEAVEQKIYKALRVEVTSADRTQSGNKRGGVELPENAIPQSVQNRCLPFPVLQGLLLGLQSLQSFPEERMLHLRCDSGISTVVVWCHHILGMSLAVSVSGTLINFGDGPSNILVEETGISPAGATLMNPADQHEPLFNLVNNEANPSIGTETRAEAFGFGQLVLENANLSEDDAFFCSHWIIAQALTTYKERRSDNKESSEALSDRNRHIPSKSQGKWRYPSRERLMGAGRFLFRLDPVDMEAIESYGKSSYLPPAKRTLFKSVPFRALQAIVITFARIMEKDLEDCRTMPLSLQACLVLQKRLKADYTHFVVDGDETVGLLTAFENLSVLLLGYLFSEEYVKSAVLLSAWGWSVFLDSVDAVDPGDVSVDSVRVMCGVPSREGLRRRRIIDGPTACRMSDTSSELVSELPRIHFFPGVSTAKRGLTLVGLHSDAFQVTQNFNWTSLHTSMSLLDKPKAHQLGFRKMQELCLQADRLPPCRCDVISTDIVAWSNARRFTPLGMHELVPPGVVVEMPNDHESNPTRSKFCWTIAWDKMKSTQAKTPEQIFVRNPVRQDQTVQDADHEDSVFTRCKPTAWVFYVSQSPASRWLQLDDLCNKDKGVPIYRAIRGHDTCFECATGDDTLARSKPTVLLL